MSGPLQKANETSRIFGETKPLTASWLWFLGSIVVLCLIYQANLISWISEWSNNADYSHGFLVPVFAAYVLWFSREKLTKKRKAHQRDFGLRFGVGLALLAIALRLVAIYIRSQYLEGISLIPLVLGVMLIVFGVRAFAWGAPAACFLVFMIPLPGMLAGQLSNVLQAIATQISTFGLQTLGVASFAQGNIITLNSGQIGVAEACSGLRMLFSFFALTAAFCMVADRSWYERLLIMMATIPIAIAANCTRIIATGLAFESMDPATAKWIFHDVAGWFMIPLGLVFLVAVIVLLDRLIVVKGAVE